MAELDLAGIITRVCTDLMTKLRTRFSKVSVISRLNRGTFIASIDVDGTNYQLYAPTPPDQSRTVPLMDGVASIGNLSTYAIANHVHPTDTSRQATLVSGTNIKTINGTSLLGSGDLTVGGGGSELTLYTDNGFTNLWTDSGRTTTLFESFEYDYHVAKAEMSKFSAIKIWNSGLDTVYFVDRWRVDTIDDTFRVFVGVNVHVTISNHTYCLLEVKEISPS